MLTYEENNIGHNINPKVQPVLCGAGPGPVRTVGAGPFLQHRGQVCGGDCGIRPVSPVHGYCHGILSRTSFIRIHWNPVLSP